MTRKIVRSARVSQMSNPDAGVGSGGDRCTECVTAEIDANEELGPRVAGFWAMNPDQQEVAISKAMYSIVEAWNAGSDVSVPEPGSKIAGWVAAASGGKISIVPGASLTFAAARAIIDRGHIAILGLNDYSAERWYDGAVPFKWAPTEHAGHVEALVGYDEDFVDGAATHWGQTLVVHDSLRGYGMAEADYSFQSLVNCGATLYEVLGQPLPFVVDTSGAPDLSALKTAAQAAQTALAALLSKLVGG